MKLSEKIETDVIQAMRDKDTLKLSTLRMLKAAFGNYLIKEKKNDPDNDEATSIISKQAKQRRESYESFKNAGRDELADKEMTELGILEAYLPTQLSDDAIREEAKKAVTESEAKSPADMGKVMKVLMPKLKGKADGRKVQEVLKGLLNSV